MLPTCFEGKSLSGQQFRCWHPTCNESLRQIWEGEIMGGKKLRILPTGKVAYSPISFQWMVANCTRGCPMVPKPSGRDRLRLQERPKPMQSGQCYPWSHPGSHFLRFKGLRRWLLHQFSISDLLRLFVNMYTDRRFFIGVKVNYVESRWILERPNK